MAAAARVAPLPPSRPAIAWTELFERSAMPPAPPKISPRMVRLNDLALPMERDAIRVARLVDVEVGVVHDQVALDRREGGPLGEVWVGLPPTLLRPLTDGAPVIARRRV